MIIPSSVFWDKLAFEWPIFTCVYWLGWSTELRPGWGGGEARLGLRHGIDMIGNYGVLGLQFETLGPVDGFEFGKHGMNLEKRVLLPGRDDDVAT